MANKLRGYVGIDVETSEGTVRLGDRQKPIREVQLADGSYRLDEVLIIPPGEERMIWDWTRGPIAGCEALAVVCEDGGYLRGCGIYDNPTSAEDPTPTGLNERCNYQDIGCTLPTTWSRQTMGHATATTHAGKVGGVPGAWTSGGVNQRLSQLWVKNEGTANVKARLMGVGV
jgi:hypothetical protein